VSRNRSAKRRKQAVLARGFAILASNQTKVVILTLTAAARRSLSPRQTLDLVATISITDANGRRTTKTLSLRIILGERRRPAR
jgi:hypothetical protein